MNVPDFSGVVDKFIIQGEIKESFPYGNGHINSTYRLVNQGAELPDYLLQRINSDVFVNVSGMMQNIEYVTSHIRKKLINQRLNHHERVLTLIHTSEAKRYVYHEGQYWRLFEFMSALRSYDEAPTTQHVYGGGEAFGSFLSQLSDFEPSRLNITINNFHDLSYRLKQLSYAIESADRKLLSLARVELDYINRVAEDILKLHHLKSKGVFPIRVVHNDTKFNNVLFNDKGHARCVIDLDTVMPGLVHYDFGDGIRTGAVTSAEDTEDLQTVDLDIERFKAFTEGYLNGVGDVLTEGELTYLPHSTVYMSFIMGVRFLTDFLNSNIYFKVKHPMHNHVRAKCQLKLSEILNARFNEMNEVVNSRVKVFR